MSFRQALEALEVYAPRRLGRGSFQAGGLCCTMGAICPATRKLSPGTGVIDVFDNEWPEVEEIRELGLSRSDAARIVRENDWFDGTEAERYEHMLAWLRKRVAEESR